MRSLLRLAVCWAACVSFASFGTLSLPARAASPDVLQPGDHISVLVFNHDDLSAKDVIVDASGNVTLVLAGTVGAAGLTTHQLAAKITARMARYLPKAGVDVGLVSQNTSIFVTGGPVGVLPYNPGITLAAAIDEMQQLSSPTFDTPSIVAQRDLLRGRVDLHNVRLVRGGTVLITYDVTAAEQRGDPGPALLPGDRIELSTKPVHVLVQGQVKQPGAAYLDPNEPLSDAVAQVGGETEDASTGTIYLTRAGQTRQLALGDPIFSQPAQDGDLVVLPRARRITVDGMVEHPGDVLLRGQPTLMNALYNAGGPTQYGNLRDVQVVHDGQRVAYDITQLQHGGTNQNPVLSDGDTVFVPEGHKLDWARVFQAIGLGILAAHP